MAASISLQQLTREAEAAYSREEYQTAAARYQSLAEDYSRTGDALMAAEMRNNLSVALLKAGDASAAYEATRGTDAIFAQAADARRQGIALSNQAAALEALNQTGEALELYRQASAFLKEAGQPEMRSYVLKSLSLLQFRRHQRFEAMSTMRVALDLQKHLTLRERLLKWLLAIVFRLLGG